MNYGFFNDSAKFRRNVQYFVLTEMAGLMGVPGFGKSEQMVHDSCYLAAGTLADLEMVRQCLNN